MKNYEVNYIKGHLVDVKSGKRIFLKRGGRFFISGDNENFEEKDELSLDKKPMTPNEQAEWLQNKHRIKGHLIERLAPRNSELFYRIGLSKITGEDRNREFLFQATLLEDLYMYSTDHGSKWSLCDCLCETSQCIEGDIQMIEPVRGLSLNNLFSNMVAFYFPMQRSGACNAFDTFFYPGKITSKLFDLKEKHLKSLGDKRESIVQEYKH